MSYCPECGLKLEDIENFCPFCGYRFSEPIVMNEKDKEIIELKQRVNILENQLKSIVSTNSNSLNAERINPRPQLTTSNYNPQKSIPPHQIYKESKRNQEAWVVCCCVLILLALVYFSTFSIRWF